MLLHRIIRIDDIPFGTQAVQHLHHGNFSLCGRLGGHASGAHHRDVHKLADVGHVLQDDGEYVPALPVLPVVQDLRVCRVTGDAVVVDCGVEEAVQRGEEAAHVVEQEPGRQSERAVGVQTFAVDRVVLLVHVVPARLERDASGEHVGSAPEVGNGRELVSSSPVVLKRAIFPRVVLEEAASRPDVVEGVEGLLEAHVDRGVDHEALLLRAPVVEEGVAEGVADLGVEGRVAVLPGVLGQLVRRKIGACGGILDELALLYAEAHVHQEARVDVVEPAHVAGPLADAYGGGETCQVAEGEVRHVAHAADEREGGRSHERRCQGCGDQEGGESLKPHRPRPSLCVSHASSGSRS